MAGIRKLCAVGVITLAFASIGAAFTPVYGEVASNEPRIMDMSNGFGMHGPILDVDFDITQDLRGRLAGMAQFTNQETNEVLILPLSGRLSVNGTGPVRMLLSGKAGVGPTKRSFVWTGFGDASNLESLIAVEAFGIRDGYSGEVIVKKWNPDTGFQVLMLSMNSKGKSLDYGNGTVGLPYARSITQQAISYAWQTFGSPVTKTHITGGGIFLSFDVWTGPPNPFFGDTWEATKCSVRLPYGRIDLDPSTVGVNTIPHVIP